MIQLIIFLGNPGNEHTRDRHNIGWMAAETLSFYHSLDWQKKFKGVYCQHRIGNRKYYFLKPENYMNLSGESAQPMMNFFKIKADELLVVHDDLELNFGQISIKKGGGLGGHNGLRSISNSLGTQDFFRFRLGISRPARGSVSSYVLSPFSTEETISLPLYLEKASAVLEECLVEGIDKRLVKFQKQNLVPLP